MTRDPLFHIRNVPETSQAAEKQKRYRERRKDGGAVFMGTLTGKLLQGLIEMGWIDQRDLGNPRALAGDLMDLAECYVKKNLNPPFPDESD